MPKVPQLGKLVQNLLSAQWPVAHKGFPAITTARLWAPLTQFTDDKTEAKSRCDLPKAMKPKTRGMDLSTSNLSRNLAKAGTYWELSLQA